MALGRGERTIAVETARYQFRSPGLRLEECTTSGTRSEPEAYRCRRILVCYIYCEDAYQTSETVCRSALAASPVPVPMSKIVCGSSPMGAMKFLSPMSRKYLRWFKSMRSCSPSSTGNPYSIGGLSETFHTGVIRSKSSGR
jgi:hypothetical protein